MSSRLTLGLGLLITALLTAAGLTIADPAFVFNQSIDNDDFDYDSNSSSSGRFWPTYAIPKDYVKASCHWTVLKPRRYGLVLFVGLAASSELAKQHIAPALTYKLLSEEKKFSNTFDAATNGMEMLVCLNPHSTTSQNRAVNCKSIHWDFLVTTGKRVYVGSQPINRNDPFSHCGDWSGSHGYFLLQYPPLNAEQTKLGRVII